MRETYLRQLWRNEKVRKAEFDRKMRARTRWGVFIWNGEGRYPAEAAVEGKLYKSEKVADKARLRLDPAEQTLVLRPVLLDEPPAMTPAEDDISGS